MRSARPALAPAAARQLHRQADGAQDVDQILDLAYGFNAFGVTIRPSQSRWEFRQLLENVAEIRPRRMLEIGTANGGSLFAFMRVCAPDAHVISVDLPHGKFGGGYPIWKVPIYKSFGERGQRLDLLRGDSHSPETLASVKSLLGGETLDFLFIDGDHSYEGVRHDFESYRSLVRPGGLIAFHDIAPPHAGVSKEMYDPGDVPQFWTELKAQYGGQEFVDPSGHGCFGIGIIAV
jgi:predicted O-methyltransferase YrrM